MAAEPTIAIGADADPFGLTALVAGANFKSQSSSNVTNNSFAQAMDANGDLAVESPAFDIRNDYTADYKYSGSDMIGELEIIATALWVHNAIAVESLSVAFSAADYATISLTGHQHNTTTHDTAQGAKWDWSGLFQAAQTGFGIPALTLTTHVITNGTVSSTTDMTITIALTHVDHITGAGVHFIGSNTGCRVDISASGVGAFSDLTIGTSWKTDSSTDSDSNTDHDTWAFNGHLFLTRN